MDLAPNEFETLVLHVEYEQKGQKFVFKELLLGLLIVSKLILTERERINTDNRGPLSTYCTASPGSICCMGAILSASLNQ